MVAVVLQIVQEDKSISVEIIGNLNQGTMVTPSFIIPKFALPESMERTCN